MIRADFGSKHPCVAHSLTQSSPLSLSVSTGLVVPEERREVVQVRQLHPLEVGTKRGFLHHHRIAGGGTRRQGLITLA